MFNISLENINPEPEPAPLRAWENPARILTVKLTEWTINSRLEVVNVVCEVRP